MCTTVSTWTEAIDNKFFKTCAGLTSVTVTQILANVHSYSKMTYEPTDAKAQVKKPENQLKSTPPTPLLTTKNSTPSLPTK